jgi:hypothetical protein
MKSVNKLQEEKTRQTESVNEFLCAGLKAQYIIAQWQSLGKKINPQNMRPERAMYICNPDLLFVLTQNEGKKVKTMPASLEKRKFDRLKSPKLISTK